MNLTMKPKFILSTDSNEKRTMYFSLLHKYQIGLEQSIKGTNFILDYFLGMYIIYAIR